MKALQRAQKSSIELHYCHHEMRKLFYALCAFSERNAKYFLLPLFYLSIFNEIFFSLSIESLKIIIYQAKKKQEEPN